MSALHDEIVRERASRGFDRSMALSAGAGTGKTTVLVERLLALLRSGVPPGRLAAITFTVKATGELQERVRDRLERELTALEGADRARVQAVLADFPALTLSTIHAFSQSLLQREALEAGWAPGTDILAETFAASAVDRAYQEWRHGFDERHRSLAVPLRGLVTEQTLEEAARTVLFNRDLTPVVGAAAAPWTELKAALEGIRARLVAALEGCRRPAECPLVKKNQALLDLLARACALDDAEAAVLAVLEDGDDGNKQGGSKKIWDADALTAFKAALDDFRTGRGEWQRARWEPLHRALVLDLLEHFVPAAEAAKRATSQADYQDLLFGCAELLTGRPAARARLAARFDAILVDEVQDTDPIQADILARLAREPVLEGAWNAHPLRPGKAFVVGDPKQSIYRFRRADVHQWRELTELVGRDGEVGSLRQNFRSVPGLVAFVNHAFAEYPEYEPLVAFRPAGPLDPVAVVEAGDDESDAVARHLLDLRRGGGRVVDAETGEPRPMGWADVMILLPSWTKAEEVQDAMLAAGIPSVVEGGRAFSDRDEIRVCIAALRAIEEPADGEAVVLVLQGLFGFSLEQLAEHVSGGGSWRYTVPDQPAGPVGEALDVLGALHGRRGHASWVALLDDLLEETRAPAVWSMLDRGAAMLANVDKLRMIVRALEPATRSGGELIERLRELKKQPEEDLPFVDVETDAVRITTYFKAKGLEAPVVVLCHVRRQWSTPSHFVDRVRREVRIRAGSLYPPGWAEWEAREDAEHEAERRRWMYVAATRARDHLVIVRGGKPDLLAPDLLRGLPDGERTEHEARVEVAPGATVWYRRAPQIAAVAYDPRTFGSRDPAVEALLERPAAAPLPDELGEAWRRQRRERLGRAKRASTRWKSVSDLAREGMRPRRTERDHTAAGTVVHRVMEHLDFGAAPDEMGCQADALASAFAAAAGLSDELAERCRSIVGRLLQHEVVAWARQAPEVWREVPFAFPEKGRTVTGTIDLCFPRDAARRVWVVADWKSHLPAVGTPERERYERQLELYARALVKNLTGAEPDEVIRRLVGPHPELATTPETDALAEVHDDLRGGLARLLGEGAPLPEVGRDVGSPVVASNVELVWEAQRVALALDPAADEVVRLREQGWTVVEALSDEIGWAERALRAVAARLQVREPSAESADPVPGAGQ